MTQPGLLTYRSLIWNFAQRDLKSRFKGTLVGWGWSLLLPIASLLTYTLVAHYIFRATVPDFGNGHKANFAVWLFVGLTAWNFFAGGLLTAIAGLVGNGPLLKKIYFPSYASILGSVVAVGVQSLIEVGLLLVVVLLFGNIGLSWLLLPVWVLLFAAFVAGTATVCSIANIYFRDLQHLITVAIQLLFYATPILYEVGKIPAGPLRRILSANPLSQFVDLFRDMVYGLTPGSWKSWAYIFVWSVLAVAAGVWVFKRNGRDLGEQL